MSCLSMESRPLKKLRLGPPDVYPQDPKQKEDELTPVNVKQGFSHTPNLNQAEEYGSAKNHSFPLSKVQSFINGVLSKKQEINTLPDTGRKRQLVNPKENFHNVTPKSKAFIEAWFKDLAGSKPLINLGKRVPIFNKKEEIFIQLSEYQVPMIRAVWLIKMTSAYSVAISEAKMKKRQVPDSSQEWTATLVRFLKEQLLKLQDFYQKSANFSSLSSAYASNATTYHNGSPLMSDDQKLALRQFNYCQQLSKAMFEEGLLECQDFLQWQLDMLEKCKTCDDGLLKLVIPFILQYVEEFTQCEILSRKLVFQICRRITPLLSDQINDGSSSNLDLGICGQHRNILIQMSSIIQDVVLHCPTSLVWNHSGEGKISSHLVGSPLDHLQVSPSALPMAPRFSNDHVRDLLREAEEMIKKRSEAAEYRWPLDKLIFTFDNFSSKLKQQPQVGALMSKVLQVLEALDRHSFDRVDSTNNIDILYSKIFPSVNGNKSNVDLASPEHVTQLAKQDEPYVRLLCQWAVSDQRYGEHRAMAAALLLEKRQADLMALTENDFNGSDENDTDENSAASVLLPVFQGFLMKFLDSEAPVLHDPIAASAGHNNRAIFSSLVHLFYELIKHDVFSHDTYMCTLISRGDLLTVSINHNGNTVANSSTNNFGGPPSSGMTGFQCNDLRSEMDDSKIDDDLGKLLQHIKEEQQIVMDTPDSPKDESHGTLESGRSEKEGKRQSRHLLFTTHFPLPQDDSLIHDCNQRHILLFGVGKAREESRHAVKKVSKEMCRLFHKKLAIDIQTEGTNLVGGVGAFVGSSKSRKHSSRFEFNFESSMQRFLALSYFDRHAVAAQAASTCMEMFNSFTVGVEESERRAVYLPVLEHISFLFDLFEVSLNISGLIDLCMQLLKELPEVELLLSQRNSVLSRSYSTNVGLYVIGVLRRFHCCLLLSPESTATVFESLCRLVKHVTNPADCSSAERCILAYLYDLYSCSSFLKGKSGQLDSSLINSNSSTGRGSSGTTLNSGSEVFAFSNAYPKIKQTIFAPVQSLPKTLHPLNRDFLQDYISNPRRKPESHILRQLSDSAQMRYSFVCNVVVAVCNEVDNDKLNDIALLCAELTAGCSALSAEWLGVLTTLCYSASTYMDVLTQVDVQDNAIHHNLAVLFSVLLARHCFGLQDFLLYVGVPSLVKIWNEGGRSDADPEAEAGARLTCHLVLRLFKTSDAPHPACYSNISHSVNASPHHTLQQSTPSSLGVKLACDRHLLAATHNSISVGPVLAVLKAILVLADRVPPEGKSSRLPSSVGNINSSNRLCGSSNSLTNEVSISHILGTSWNGDFDSDIGSTSFGIGGSRNNSGNATENVPLGTYARYVLRQICSQPWVHQRCLQNPDELLKLDGLLDSCLSLRQAQRLLQMISRPDTGASAAEDTNNEPQDYRQVVNRVLESLDQWRLRVAWLDLQLLCQQLTSTGSGGASSADMNQFLEAVARAVLDVFELSATSGIKDEPDVSGGSTLKKRAESTNTSVTASTSASTVKTSSSLSISLIAPLVSKLTGSVQGRILKVASQVLESCNWTPPSKGKEKERSTLNPAPTLRSKSLLSYEPLLSLVMTCLKGQDEQREAFLSSLHSQLSHFIFLPKEDRLYQGEDTKARQTMLEALQLRFSLVGGLFDSILRNPAVAIDWALLLTQLVTSGVVDFSNNPELFPTLQDMLATLLHSTLVTDGQSDRGEDSRKYHPILIKKLKKELAERKGSPSIQCIKQLLPIPKLASEFVTCEPYGTLTDTKGNKISGFDSNDKKQGHRLYEKQRVSPWEILEGHKTAAPLSWAWFGAVRVERKPLRHQEVQRLLRHHTHSLHKPASYFLEHPILPPEELDIPIEKIVPKDEVNFKMEIPTSDQSPRGGTKRGQKSNQRRPRGRRGAAAAAAAAQAANVAGAPTSAVPYQNPVATGMYPPSQPPPQWNSYTSPAPPAVQQGTVPNPAAFFPQQAVGPRFPTERPGTQSRQALSNMLRQRHPGTQFVPGSAPVPNQSGASPVVIPSASSIGVVPPNSRVGASLGTGGANQPQFSGVSLADKHRQQFMRQQMRQQHTGGNIFGQQGSQQQPPTAQHQQQQQQHQQQHQQQQQHQHQQQHPQQHPQQHQQQHPQHPQQQQQQQHQQQQPQQQAQQQTQPQVPMASGNFSNMHGAGINQNFNMFQGGGQSGMQQLVNTQQAQVQPPAQQQQQAQSAQPPQVSQQGMMGQHFNQAGGNFPMQQTQQQGNMVLMQHPRGMTGPNLRPPFMSSGGMQMNSQPSQFVRTTLPNTVQQQAVRMQHQQMVANMQQQQHQQQLQHNMGQQHSQHYHQPF